MATTLRRALLGILLFSMLGSGLELLLLEHYEDYRQSVPLVVLGAASVALVAHAARPGRGTLLALRVVMLLLLVAGSAGVVLHYQGSAEFQRELDPSLSGLSLLRKTLRAKTPPALAPGMLVQLGLLGLVYAWQVTHARERREIGR